MLKTNKKYFLMTNIKGDYGSFIFEDYNQYKKTWIYYKNLDFIAEELLQK